MNLHVQQQSGEPANALATALPALPTPATISTPKQFSRRNPAFSESAVRNLIFKAEPRQSTKGEIPGNGLIEAGAILRVGRKVLIDEDRFFDWVRRQNSVVTTVLRRRSQKNGRLK